MADTVLVPYEGSPQATAALEFAVGEFAPERLYLLYVVNPVEAGYLADVREADRANELVAEARQRLTDTGIEVTTAVESGRPAQKIVDYAAAEGVDTIVMGSHGREGVARILLGSVAETVVRRAPVPVCIVR